MTITCESCSTVYEDATAYCPSCGLSNPEHSDLDFGPTRDDLKSGREVGTPELQTTFQSRPQASRKEKSASYRLRRTAQRYNFTSRERTEAKHERATRDLASRLQLNSSIVALAVVLSRNLPPRTSMGHLAAASLIVAAWSLGHFVDLKEAGYNNDARLRKVARALASISGIAPVQYTVRDYIEAFRVN